MVGNIISQDIFIKFLEISIMALEVIYVIVAFIMTRQVKLMNDSFITGAAGAFRTAANTHFLVAVGLVLVSLLLY